MRFYIFASPSAIHEIFVFLQATVPGAAARRRMNSPLRACGQTLVPSSQPALRVSRRHAPSGDCNRRRAGGGGDLIAATVPRASNALPLTARYSAITIADGVG